MSHYASYARVAFSFEQAMTPSEPTKMIYPTEKRTKVNLKSASAPTPTKYHAERAFSSGLRLGVKSSLMQGSTKVPTVKLTMETTKPKMKHSVS